MTQFTAILMRYGTSQQGHKMSVPSTLSFYSRCCLVVKRLSHKVHNTATQSTPSSQKLVEGTEFERVSDTKSTFFCPRRSNGNGFDIVDDESGHTLLVVKSKMLLE